MSDAPGELTDPAADRDPKAGIPAEDDAGLPELSPSQVMPSVDDDVRRNQDATRTRLAFLLVYTLMGLLAAAFATVWLAPRTGWAIDPSNPDGPPIAVPYAVMRLEVVEILKQALAPLITLIGTIAGFYYGKRE